MSVDRDPFRDAKEGSSLIREAGAPHYQEVLRRATFIIAECESAIRDSFITRDKLKALLGMSVELNKVRIGECIVGLEKEPSGQEPEGKDSVQEKLPAIRGADLPIIEPLKQGRGGS